MVDKLHDYQGSVGRLHTIRDNIKASYSNWKENQVDSEKKLVNSVIRRNVESNQTENEIDYDFSYINRRKTRWELLRLSAVIAGIEFSYSAITAFSSPILLEMGVRTNLMSMVFSLSPLLGFFLTPICGSLSDRCTSSFGRRRIFIIIFSLFELLGLFLIPYGYSKMEIFNQNILISDTNRKGNFTVSNDTTHIIDTKTTESVRNGVPSWIIFVTVVGIVIADHCADACQNPSRAYLLDVCNEADHTRGLSTFTILAGCGGTIGYGLGAIDWDTSFLSGIVGGHIKTVFTITSVLFAFCVILTVMSFKEIPLKFVNEEYQKSNQFLYRESTIREPSEQETMRIHENGIDTDNKEESTSQFIVQSKIEEVQNLRVYLSSIVKLPYSMRILLMTNVLCWMSHVCYSLYFTDYVGEAIFGGDPKAPMKSIGRKKYEEGVRFACRGMSVYSFSCMICSLFMEKMIEKFGLKRVYMVNLAIDTISMLLMFAFNCEETALLLSFAKGVLYCSIFTIPYIIVANYHTLNVFEVDSSGEYIPSTQIRGLGTDISIIGSSVFIAQFFLSFCMGFIISFYGSARAVPLVCAILSFLAVISASQVVYLNL